MHARSAVRPDRRQERHPPVDPLPAERRPAPSLSVSNACHVTIVRRLPYPHDRRRRAHAARSRTRSGPARCSPIRSRSSSTRATPPWWRADARSSRSRARPTTSSRASGSQPSTACRSCRAGAAPVWPAPPRRSATHSWSSPPRCTTSSRSGPRIVSRGSSRVCSTSICRPRSVRPASSYAPDPSSQQTSSIGGNVNTNAGGPHCLAYGVTSAHVLALDVVMPDGSVERLGSEGPEAPGYDLRGVVVGSEGTLGIVARVCVRLTPLPPVGPHDAARLHGRERLRGDGLGHHRARRRPGGRRDDGPRHHRGRRELRARRLSDRRRRDPDRRGRRAALGCRGADARGGGRRAREPRPHDPRRGRRRRSARCCGRGASPRSARSRRSRPTITCTIASCRAPSSSRC